MVRTMSLRRGWEDVAIEGECGERAGARTQDPVIKSHVLYRLSYALAPRRSVATAMAPCPDRLSMTASVTPLALGRFDWLEDGKIPSESGSCLVARCVGGAAGPVNSREWPNHK